MMRYVTEDEARKLKSVLMVSMEPVSGRNEYYEVWIDSHSTAHDAESEVIFQVKGEVMSREGAKQRAEQIAQQLSISTICIRDEKGQAS